MKPLSRKKHIEQIGIDIRQSGYQEEMKAYMEILKEEIKITQRFLHECSAGERKFERLIEEEFSNEQKALAKENGTPAEFALEIYKLVPHTISMDEADTAIQKYRCEFHDAGSNSKENTVDRPRGKQPIQ